MLIRFLAMIMVFAVFTFSAAQGAETKSKTPSKPDKGKKEVKDDADYWVAEMKKVHANFKGEKGTFAHFGDSITVTLAFWTGLFWSRNNMDAQMKNAYEIVKPYMAEKCWKDWKGPEFGNQGSMTIQWASENVDAWLKKLNPETVLLMFGTNDVRQVPLEEYVQKTREVIQKCLNNGTIVILSTIPPKHGDDEKVKLFVEAERKIAREMKIPLTDYYDEIMKRRPDDWDGALDKFKGSEGYDVPTLISRDGVHPSAPQKWANDYSEEGMKNHGFGLRNYTVLLKYAEVIQKALK
jgi:lysophospholipase L1-like esterase